MFDRGRSERFAELVEEAGGRRHRHRRTDLDCDLAPLVRLARRVADADWAEPGADFRGGLRAVLVATIERDGVGTVVDQEPARAATRAALAARTQIVGQVPTTGSGRARAAVLVGVAAGALALSGVSAASSNALPGDPLYQVKRSSEQAQLALAGSDLSRGQLYLQLAHDRSEEARQVGPQLLAQVLADMDAETREGVSLLTAAAVQRNDHGVLDNVLRFVDEQRTRLTDVKPLTAESVLESLVLLDAVQTRAEALKVTLAHGCTTTTTDDLGPEPKPC